METYLICLVNGKPKTWAKWLAWTEYWYNTSMHASIFLAVDGRNSPPLFRFEQSSIVASLEDQLLVRDV